MLLYFEQVGLHTHGLQLACCRVPEASSGCASALLVGMRVVIWTMLGWKPWVQYSIEQERPYSWSNDRFWQALETKLVRASLAMLLEIFAPIFPPTWARGKVPAPLIARGFYVFEALCDTFVKCSTHGELTHAIDLCHT